VRFDKKSVLIMVVLVAISSYLTTYTLEAYIVATGHLYEDPNSKALAWRSGPPGSLFPWPREPGMLDVLSSVNDADAFIYRYLIRPWTLVGLSALLWIIAGLSVARTVRTRVRATSS
jgi:hypothetical protein